MICINAAKLIRMKTSKISFPFSQKERDRLVGLEIKWNVEIWDFAFIGDCLQNEFDLDVGNCYH